MSDPIYGMYLTDGPERKKILRMLRKMAKQAGLDRHGISIFLPKGGKLDEVETRANLYAEQMLKKPGLHAYLQGNAKVSSLASIDAQGFASDDGQKRVVVGKRASNVITGKSRVMPYKAEKNRNEERRLGIASFCEVENEVTADNRQGKLALKNNNNAPIDPAKRIRDITVQEIRSLLDRQYCNGFTALRVLLIAVFAKQSSKLNTAHASVRRSREEEIKCRQQQKSLGVDGMKPE